jgi:hypothetical protein
MTTDGSSASTSTRITEPSWSNSAFRIALNDAGADRRPLPDERTDNCRRPSR